MHAKTRGITLQVELFETLKASMPDRVEAAIREGGGHTKYYLRRVCGGIHKQRELIAAHPFLL